MRTLTISLVALVFIIIALGAAFTFHSEKATSAKPAGLEKIPVADTGAAPAPQGDQDSGAFRQEAEEAEKAAKDALDAARRYANKLGENIQKKVDEWGEKAGEALADELDALQGELEGLENRLDELEKELEQEQEREQPAEREGLTTI